MGRPSKLTNKLQTKILKAISAGITDKQLILDKIIPSRQRLFDWLKANKEFHDKFYESMNFSALSDELNVHQMATDTMNGELDPNRAKVSSDLFLRLAKARKPHRFNDKALEEPDRTLNVVINKMLDVPRETLTIEHEGPTTSPTSDDKPLPLPILSTKP